VHGLVHGCQIRELTSKISQFYESTQRYSVKSCSKLENQQTRLKSVKLDKLGPSLPSLKKLTKSIHSSQNLSPLHPVCLTKIPLSPNPPATPSTLFLSLKTLIFFSLHSSLHHCDGGAATRTRFLQFTWLSVGFFRLLEIQQWKHL